MWFFLPQIWWLRSQLLIDQEFLADRTAALRYGTSCDYASSLLCHGTRSTRAVSSETQPTEQQRDKSRPPLAEGEVPLASLRAAGAHVACIALFGWETRGSARSWSWALRITLSAATVVAACLCIRWPSAAALEHGQRHGAGSKPPQFRVTDFTAEPLIFSKDGRVVSYVMPVALPSEYVLSVDVLSTPVDLAKVRIAGHSLRGNTPGPGDEELSAIGPAKTLESWHHVQLVRQGDRVSLSIDGQLSAACSSPQAITEWLTFEPSPTRVTQFRNLVVDW